jgi:hypothetical protein
MSFWSNDKRLTGMAFNLLPITIAIEKFYLLLDISGMPIEPASKKT